MRALDRWEESVRSEIRAGRAPSLSSLTALADDVTLGRDGAARAAADLGAAVIGLGPLADLVADERVTDVLVNGDGAVWVDRGAGVEDCGVRVAIGDLRALAVRLAGSARRRLDDAQPWVDGLLPGGVRLHAILPPLVDSGPHICLRIPRHQPQGVDALAGLGAVGPALAETLREVVRARLSFLVTGGTGTGKTTVLGALLAECDPRERIVLVEDVRELAPLHPHVVRLQGRAPNIEGAGSVTMTDLVRQALRMRPDRLVVGEVRGAEVRELLAALNTGHEGGGGTVHANSVLEVPARIEALGALAGMPRAAVHAQLAGAVDIVIGLGRCGGRRVVRQVGVLTGADGRARVDLALSGDGTRTVEEGAASALRRLLEGGRAA